MGSPPPPTSRPASSPTPTPGAAVQHRRLERIRKLGRVLDTAIPVPGTSFRFGLDPVIGLVPGLGDAVGTVLSGYIVIEATRFGASLSVLLRMLMNVALEAVVGLVPAAGDIFDAIWKSNTRNLRLLERHLVNPDTTRARSRGYLMLVVISLVTVAALSIAGILWLGGVLLRVLGL